MSGPTSTRIRAALAKLHDLDRELDAVEWWNDDHPEAAAAALDARGAPAAAGPLWGRPITVKDWIDVAGFPCAGIDVDAQERHPSVDATAVGRLRAAGAIVLAKTKAWNGIKADAPPVRHPLDRTRTPGGSSSGEAAVTAAGGSTLGIGSDSGGSVRLPAAWTGVYGYKPTAGLIPTTGHFPEVGPAADGRTQLGLLGSDLSVIDAARLLMAGPDGRDPGVVPVPTTPADPASLGGLRFAVVAPDPAFPTSTTIDRAVDAVRVQMIGAGMVEVPWPWAWLGESYDITLRYWARASLGGGQVARQLEDWDRFRTRFLTAMDHADLLVTPTTAEVAPPHRPMTGEDFAYALPASLTGSPAISVPRGDDGGLPLAVQLIGRPWADATVIATAAMLGSP